jgi:hypothetical protein
MKDESLCTTCIHIGRDDCNVKHGAMYTRVWRNSRMVTTKCDQHELAQVEFEADDDWQTKVTEVTR